MHCHCEIVHFEGPMVLGASMPKHPQNAKHSQNAQSLSPLYKKRLLKKNLTE